MKIVIAIDSFKGSLSSVEAGEAAAAGIRRVFPDAGIVIRPVADGGEGTVDALVKGMGGRYAETTVSDPLGRKISARYGILPGNTAVIEMAAASGLTLLSEKERDPMSASTFGTGEMILDAVRNGCRDLIIGIGGSATNDGGIGCLQALGFGMLGIDGEQVCPGAEGLAALERISADNIPAEVRECSFSVACDVTNPLCGENGCSRIFAPQKGADDESITVMDGLLRKYAELTKDIFPAASPDTPGAGAAGGMGFALMYYLGAELVPGAELIMRKTNLEDELRNCDIVVTGEGRIDSQTSMGKAPSAAARLAKKYGKPVIAFCGCTGGGAELCNSCGIDAFFPVLRKITSLEDAMDKDNARKNLSDTAEQVFRAIKISEQLGDKI